MSDTLLTAQRARELANASEAHLELFLKINFLQPISLFAKDGKYQLVHGIDSQEPWRSLPELDKNYKYCFDKLKELGYNVSYCKIGTPEKPFIFGDLDCEDCEPVQRYGIIVDW